MNNIDKRYQELLQDILDNGVTKGDRTGTGTISVFGRQIRHKMSEGFPLLTTKKMHWKSIVTELLWFLRGDTNIKFLLDYDCHIWDGDAYKNYSTKNFGKTIHTKEQFIQRIKSDDDFAKTWGELGPIYGRQWRNWGGKEDVKVSDERDENGYLKFERNFIEGIDQIQNLINDLKNNPDSRRLMVSAWNVGDLDSVVLPPCHYGFQIYTRKLTVGERLDLASKKYKVFDPFDFGHPAKVDHDEIDKLYPVPKRAISLMWNQRSVDTFLGLPFNIASYGLLLEIIAKEVNMVPDELIGNLGDVHLYTNHIEQAKEQIGRKYTADERVEMLKNAMGEDKYNEAVEDLMPFAGGLSEHYEYHKIPYHSREPYELPTVEITERNWYMHEKVKERLGPKSFNEKILSYRPDCFELINYQSHGKIKAPLSN
jgi:thymidylate synthase